MKNVLFRDTKTYNDFLHVFYTIKKQSKQLTIIIISQIINYSSGTDPELLTAGTDPGRRLLISASVIIFEWYMFSDIFFTRLRVIIDI